MFRIHSYDESIIEYAILQFQVKALRLPNAANQTIRCEIIRGLDDDVVHQTEGYDTNELGDVSMDTDPSIEIEIDPAKNEGKKRDAKKFDSTITLKIYIVVNI